MNAYHSIQTSGITWPAAARQTSRRAPQEGPRRFHPRPSGLLEEHEKQGGGSVPRESVLDVVRKHYLLPADDSVLSYLTHYPSTLQVLAEAAPRLKQYFGGAAIFRLKAPVDEAGIRTLYVVVVWPDEIGAVRRALDKFDDEWWLIHSRQTAEYVVFTYELV